MYYILLGLIIYALLLYLVSEKYKLLSEIMGIIILIFITFMVGLRYGVGIDYFTYENAFNTQYNNFTYEPIYSILLYLIKIIFDKFYYLTLLLIIITNIFIYLGLKKREVKGLYLILAIFIYSSNSLLVFMNLMRQGVAVAIFFYAVTFIKERNFKKYFIYILLGAGFHFSILFLLPMYFINKIKFSKVSYLISILICYALVYTKVAQYLLNFIVYRIPIYSKYYNSSFILNNDIKSISMGVLLNVVFFYILIFFSNKNRNEEYSLEESYYMIGLLINILSISTFMFDRIGIYFSIFGLVAIPKMIENFENKNLRLLFFILALLVTSSFFIHSLFIAPEIYKLEYRSIFFTS